ncbi:hypothetical protein R5R35_014791 [Gryllus longicercus]|uniref:Transmembrane protein 245 n=1 Tax=Gryllus longicercus TaxID=2509291 RepID=A0AAN9ZA71_9ORTH
MYSPSLEFLKSPIENVVNLLGGVPQDHEKALKHGFYNALAILLLMIALSAGWAVFIVLEPFFKPLLWALLCGSVLYPIKHSLATSMNSWLSSLPTNSTPLLLGIIIVPIQILDNTSERIGNVTLKYIKYIVGFVLCLCICHIMYQYTPHICICIIWKLGMIGSNAISWFMSLFDTYRILAIILGYIILLISFWTPDTAHYFTLAAVFLWMAISLFLASLASSFQVTIFFVLQCLFGCGFGYEVLLVYKKMSASNISRKNKNVTLFDAFNALCHGKREHLIYFQEESLLSEEKLKDVNEKNENEQGLDKENLSKPKDSANVEIRPKDLVSGAVGSINNPSEKEYSNIETISQKDVRKRLLPLDETASSSGIERSTPSFSETSFQKQMIAAALHKHKARIEVGSSNVNSNHRERPESTKYLYGLTWACVLLSMWTYFWLLHATYILLLIYIIKHTGQYFHIWQMIEEQIKKLWTVIHTWYSSRHEALFPVHITGFFKLATQMNGVMMEILKDSVNMACCTIVILGVICAIISTIVFLTVQVYSEGIHMLQVGSSILNSTYMRNTKLMDGWQSQLDSIVNDAYSYGRQGISSGVHHWLKDVDPEKASQLEEQVLQLWDRIYQAWMTSNNAAIGPKVTTSAIYASFDSLVEDVQKTPELLNMAGIMAFLQDNVGTLLTVFDSLWIILKGNITLFMDSFLAIIMIVFGSGTAVINFFLNLIVFFTALFYLLASSNEMYKPVDLITKYSPNSGKRFAVALEDAIASVFHASIKRAIIYGLWTWLIHNLFQVKLVYIPSVLAAMLGAIPVMPVYLPSAPAVLELYFQDCTFYAVLLSIIQVVSASTIDSTIYKEIKGGGHPYLTALSIAGGMFWLGPEGVIMGPLLLCALFVAVNMSTYILQDNESEQELQEQMKHLSELSRLTQLRKSVS